MYEFCSVTGTAGCWRSATSAARNEWIVREGWALDFRKYSTDYLQAEAEAKRAGAGIWRGEFTPPRDRGDHSPCRLRRSVPGSARALQPGSGKASGAGAPGRRSRSASAAISAARSSKTASRQPPKPVTA
jgi:hypothetical protein